MNGMQIQAASWPGDLDTVRALFREYVQGLGIDLGFQDFEGELAALPGKYLPPAGRLLLAWHAGQAVGCAALRPIDDLRCEMKRLYVRPAARGTGLGRILATRVLAEAREAGYEQVFLDTLPAMHAAQALYAELGFTETAPYVHNPVPGTRFLAMPLR